MKVEVTESVSPVIITLESQEEIDAIYALVNYGPISNLSDVYSSLYARMSSKDLSGPGYSVFHKRIAKLFE